LVSTSGARRFREELKVTTRYSHLWTGVTVLADAWADTSALGTSRINKTAAATTLRELIQNALFMD
jgi:hypothetical protein